MEKIKAKRRFFLIGLLVLIFVNILLPNLNFSQDLKFEHIEVSEGLPSNTVTYIYQDQKGFLWFGTRRGLVRYDGYNYKIFKNNNKTGSISSNVIKTIFEDSSGTLWVGTNRGLNSFHRVEGKFVRFMSSSNPKSISNDNINCIFEDTKKRLWIGTKYGLNLFNPKDKSFNRFFTESKKKDGNNYILTIGQNTKGAVLVGTIFGIYKINLSKSEFTRLFPLEKDNQIGPISAYFLNDREEMWSSSLADGLKKFNFSNKNIEYYSDVFTGVFELKNNLVFNIYQDNNKILWIATIKGLYLADPLSRHGIVHFHDSTNSMSLSQNDIRTIYEDRSGNFWLGTMGGGINKLVRNSQYFHHIKEGPNPLIDLNNQMVWSILRDKQGNLWIGTDDGLNLWDKTEKKYIYFKDKSVGRSRFFNNMIVSILEDSKNHLWIGTSGGGLKEFNRQNKDFETYQRIPGDQSSISSNTIGSLFEDSLKTLWVATTNGLNSFDIETKKFKRYQSKTVSDSILCLFEDSNKNLWIGTNRGLTRYDRPGDNFINSTHPDLKNNSITFIFEDSLNKLWLGTSIGLINYNPEENSTVKYGVREGMNQGRIKGILEDGQYNLWISTGKGLVKFNIQDEKFTSYNSKDGIRGDVFNSRACLKDKNGTMYFGGMKGVTHFNPENIKTNQNIPNIVITDFKLFNKSIEPGPGSILKKEITETRKIHLKYDQNFFSFEFTALDFTNQNKNMFKYKLKGIDSDWIISDSDRRVANYTGIDHGNYIFVVLGSNNDGIWNSRGTSINIIITPPFWKTWWFRLLCIMLSMFLINLFYKRRILMIKAQFLKENALNVTCVRYNISNREKEILTLLLEGKSNKEIEDLLFISYNTVKNHVYNILNKIGVKDRSKLIIFFKSIQDST